MQLTLFSILEGNDGPILKPLTTREQRLLEASLADGIPKILYQHSLLCQTYMPYKNPGDDIRTWERVNGKLKLRIMADEVVLPDGTTEKVGLPYGSKPRLIIPYINRQAIVNRSPIVDVEHSISAFAKAMGLSIDGRTLGTIREQITRIAGCHFHFGLWGNGDGRSYNIYGRIIKSLAMTSGLVDGRVGFWSSHLEMSADHYNNLIAHAVPLNETHLRSLSHNPRALDVYMWLCERLRRVTNPAGDFIPLSALQAQFGHGYTFARMFGRDFEGLLLQVRKVYRDARFEFNRKTGIRLFPSKPPVPRPLLIGGLLSGRNGE